MNRLSFASALGLMLAAACSGPSKQTGDGPVGTVGDGPAGDSPAGSDEPAGKANTAMEHPATPADAQTSPPAGITFPEPAPVSCGTDAAACDFPPSACANPTCADADASCENPWAWVIYYENPRCVGGSCVRDKRYFQCGFSTACSLGGCQFNGTVP